MRNKVTVVGAGHVGANVARGIAEKELADVVLVDVIESIAEGTALDLMDASPLLGYDVKIVGCTNDYSQAKDSDIVIITAGIPRKPGMSRDDLLNTNIGIIRSVTAHAAELSPDAIFIVVTNPLDAMCHVVYETGKFPKNRVIGMAGVLDSARFRYLIATELNVSVENTHGFVLGGHGDTMVPLPRFSTAGGIPITELMSRDRIQALVQKTRNRGADIVRLLKTASAYYAPAAATVEMAEAILKDKKKILPCAAMLHGEYGITDLFIGVPVKLGRKGIEEIIEIELLEEEQKALQYSADAVRKLVKNMTRLEK